VKEEEEKGHVEFPFTFFTLLLYKLSTSYFNGVLYERGCE